MTNQVPYTYRDTLAASERIHWRVEDIIGGDKRLDFGRPFLPESLARVEGLGFLTRVEKRILNQIRGHAYLTLFGVVEEFIVPFMMDHARPQLAADDYRTRALLQFVAEEAKHIQLFKRFREEFTRGFGRECAVIGPAKAIGDKVLSHDPLAVALLILQIEWMTQRHYVDSVQSDEELCPQFKSLLKHHWMEEAQHAKLDALMVESLAEGRTPESRLAAVDEYLEIGAFLDAGFEQQARLDVDSLSASTARDFTKSERETLVKVQHQANRWTYIGSGVTHPNFKTALLGLGPEAVRRIEEVTPAFL